MRRGKTIETNLKNIGLNKFDLEFQVRDVCLNPYD